MVLLLNKTMKFIVIKPPIIRNKPISNRNLARILSSRVFLLATVKIEYDNTIKAQKILNKTITKQDLLNNYMTYFTSMIKAVVDINKEIIAIDADLHADMESELLEKGSLQENLWGINLFPDNTKDDFIEYISLINIRPHQDNCSMEK